MAYSNGVLEHFGDEDVIKILKQQINVSKYVIFEILLAENTVLLLIDQRYGLYEMKYISNKILEYDSKTNGTNVNRKMCL